VLLLSFSSDGQTKVLAIGGHIYELPGEVSIDIQLINHRSIGYSSLHL